MAMEMIVQYVASAQGSKKVEFEAEKLEAKVDEGNLYITDEKGLRAVFAPGTWIAAETAREEK